jgi:succinate dehydrogenase/fumarate reductase flavoprotein subunit
MEDLAADLVVVGSGAAGIMAVLSAARADPKLQITLVSKGAIGRSGCSIMSQGFNAALDPADSLDAHFQDIVHAGEFLNNQELAWQLVQDAPDTVRKLESVMGCFFDRTPEGRIHQLPFAGQSFDRKVHRGDELGLEIMSCLTDQLYNTQTRLLEHTRALDLICDDHGGIAGLALLDTRKGEAMLMRTPVVIVATGGAANMYRPSSAAKEKAGDGMAMCYRVGAAFRDMEMMQFLSVGIVSQSSGHIGLPLEERLRYVGAYLYNTLGERFMEIYESETLERATRDQVVRACYQEIMAGRGTAAGGVFLDARHLGKKLLEEQFTEIVERARSLGQDPVVQPVELSPTAHFQIGGVIIDTDGASNIPGLLVAGEDAGGVHGASWTGGNGVAESTVFGARAGTHAATLCRQRQVAAPDKQRATEILNSVYAPLKQTGSEDPLLLSRAVRNLMWRKAGPVRNATGLSEALSELQDLEERLDGVSVRGSLIANPAWAQTLDVKNLIAVAKMLLVSARAREESRGVHFRSDFPSRNDAQWLRYIVSRIGADGPVTETMPVLTPRLVPDGKAI